MTLARTYLEGLTVTVTINGQIVGQLPSVVLAPPGLDKQVVFNDGGVLGTEAGFEYDKATNKLSVPGDAVVSGVVSAGKYLVTSSCDTTQLTADVNNYQPSNFGYHRSLIWDLSSNASRNITGIVPEYSTSAVSGGGFTQYVGRLLVLRNVGSNNIVLVHQSGSSSANNRFSFHGATNFTLAPGKSVWLHHSGVWTNVMSN